MKYFFSGSQIAKFIWVILPMLTFSLFLSSCERKSNDRARVSISIPMMTANGQKLSRKSAQVSSDFQNKSGKLFVPDVLNYKKLIALTAMPGPNWGVEDPTVISDIQCYGVAIGGPDTEPSLNSKICRNASANPIMSFGPMRAFLGGGQTAEFELDPGQDRKIYVFGAALADGASCETMFEDGSGISFENYSRPFLLAESKVNFEPGEMNVAMTVQENFNSDYELNQCDFIKYEAPLVPIVDASTSYIIVSQPVLISGALTNILLVTNDSMGNRINSGGSAVVFTVSQGTSTGTLGSTIDNGDGTYSADFYGINVGSPLTVSATIDGVELTTGKASLSVVPGIISPNTSIVSVASATVGAGSSVLVTLTAQDAYGNFLTSGGSSVIFSYSGGSSSGSFSATTDNGDGTYTSVFTGATAGTAISITAAIDAIPLTSSSPTLTVMSGTVSLSLSTVSVSSPTISSGNTVTVSLQSVDTVSNPLTTGGLTVAFALSGGTSTGSFSAVTDNGNGTYSAIFTGAISGSAGTVAATIGGSAVTSSLPSLMVMPGAFSLSNSFITLSSASVASGSSMTATLITKDSAGNNLTAGGNSVAFSYSGGTSTGSFSGVTDLGNGTYSINFSAVLAGTATTITATIGGSPLTSTLPTVTVTPGAFSVAQSLISVASPSVNAGSLVVATLIVKDFNGNSLTAGGLTVAFSYSGGTSTGSLSATTDNGNGSYSVNFNGVIAGSSTSILATINGSSVTSGSPSVTVYPGPISVTNSFVVVSQGSITAGSPSILSLNSRDAIGNAIFTGGHTIAFTQGGGSSSGTISAVTDNADGTYSATFTGQVAGSPTNINSTINGSAVVSAPPTITVTPGSYSLSQSVVTLASSSVVVAGTTTATLQAKDSFGNNLNVGGQSVNFLQSGGTSIVGFSAATDLGNGSYIAVITGTTPGSATSIGAQINASPVTSSLPNLTVNLISLAVSPAYPTNGVNWNDYVKFDNTPTGNKPHNQDDVACTGAESGYYGELGGCVHAGEIKKVAVPGFATCANLSIVESLNVFEWFCDSSSGTATFYSRSLQISKGLRDLVTSGGVWQTNSVNVLNFAVTIGTSSPTAWWGNSISALPTNAGVLTDLNSAGTIYYSNSLLTTLGIKITAPKISVVSLGANQMQSTGAATNNFNASDCHAGSISVAQMICAGSQNFLWIETSVNGTNGTWPLVNAIRINSGSFNRIHNTTIKDLKNNSNNMAAVEIETSNSNLILNSMAIGVGKQGGLRLSGTKNIVNKFNVARNTDVASTAQSLLVLTGSATYNRLLDIRLAFLNAGATSYGLKVLGANNIISGLYISNIGVGGSNSGVYISGVSNTIITNATISSTTNAGIELDGTTAFSNTILSHITTTHNSWNGFYQVGTISNTLINNFVSIGADKSFESPAGGGGTGSLFMNIVAAGNHGGVAVNLMGSQGVGFVGFLNVGSASPTCSGGGLSGSCSAPLTGNESLALGGKVVTDDPINSTDTNGGATFSTSLDWLAFSTMYRGWGIDNAASFPDVSQTGASITGPCRIWDLRTSNSGMLHLKSGNGSVPNQNFTPSSTCPTQVDGNTNINFAGYSFLQHALEINDDLLGNNNGLCESSEACVYSPNIGSYQGEGDYFTPGSCIFSNGVVSGVTMYAYPVNGI